MTSNGNKPDIRITRLTDYTPDPHNANMHTERGAALVGRSVERHGAGRSLVADKNRMLSAGNLTQEQMIEAGIDEVIEVRTTGNQAVVHVREDWDLSDPDPNNPARQYAYEDNRTSEIGLQWNPEVLLADLNAGFDFEDVGFFGNEVDELLAGFVEPEIADDPGAQVDRAAELNQTWQVQRGDLWQIGDHRLLCGDSTNAEDVGRLCDISIQGVFTSPPYAMQRKDQYGGIPADEYVEWWEGVQAPIRDVLTEDGSFFVNIKPHCEDGQRVLYVMDLALAMCRHFDWKFIDEFCWLRNGLPGGWTNRFKNNFEPVYQFAQSIDIRMYPKNVTDWRPQNTHHWGLSGNGSGLSSSVPEGGFGVRPSNVITIETGEVNTGTQAHPATFPTGLPSFFIKAYSAEGDAWYDPFGGSGTTMVACQQLGRQCRMMEISENYCAVILERMAGMGLEPQRMLDKVG